MPLRRSLLFLLAWLLLVPAVCAQGWSDHPDVEARVEAVLKRMTLTEKLGQLSQYSAGMPTGPGSGRGSHEEMIAAGEVGSFLNVSGENANRYQKIAVEQSRLKIPLIFGLDVIHGYRTIFPTPLALSATWDPALVERTARVAAIEASADGIRWTFSPMVDIARDARWGRITEGAGEDPHLGSAIARAYVRGYQGTSLAEPTSLLACLKHYVGYGAAEGGRDYNTTEIPEGLLRDVYLPPFKAGLDEGAATVMSAFNALNGVPASANAFILNQILRKEWQFKGFVVSDWTAIAETIAHGTAIDGAEAARKSIVAGVDLDMESNLYRTTLAGEVETGKVPISVVNEAVRRILRVKVAMGLFDDPYARIELEKMLRLSTGNSLAKRRRSRSFS
jgi:beta-glucosidase